LISIDWNKTVPKGDLDLLLDTTAINKRMADNKDNPYVWRLASFMVPKDARKEIQKNIAKKACDAFIQAQAKQDFTLVSKLQVFQGQETATDLMSGLPRLDMTEWRARGIFKTVPKPQRIELPPWMVRHDPEETRSVKQAVKDEGWDKK